jgi:nucleoside-diphosphate-sugar epimerase
MTQKKALVVGGFGFIGSAISNVLMDKNYDVTIIDNLETGNKKMVRRDGYHFLNADICSTEWEEQVKGQEFDYIFNFGSYSSDRFFSLDGNAVCRTIKGMFNIIKYAEENGVRSVVYPSSGTVYGNSAPPQSESGPTKPKSMYACTKLFLENFTQTLSGDTKYVGPRIFTGYGEGEIYKGNMASVVTLFYKSLIKGESPIVYGNGEQKRDFVYADDIANIAIGLAEKGFNGVMNVGSGKSTSFNRLIEILNDALKTDIKPRYVESPIAWVDETRADLAKLDEVLHYKPRDISQGIKDYLDGISKFGSIK